MKTTTSQKGLAIITVMLMIALMMTLMGLLIEKQHLMLRKVTNQKISEQGYQVALGVEAWAKQVLYADLDRNVDYYGEDWGELGQESSDDEEQGFSLNTESQEEEERKTIEFPVGEVKVKITDLQGRYNLNNLLYGGGEPQPRDEQKRIFLNLLENVGVDEYQTREELYGALYDWLDENDFSVANGFESTDYQTKKTPYYAADQRLISIGELKHVEGFNQELINELAVYVSVLPEDLVRVNINTAEPEVLAALSSTPITDISSVQAFLQIRENEAFTGFIARDVDGAVDAVASVSAVQRQQPFQYMMQINSQYFQVNAQWTAGDYNYCMQSVLYRTNADPSNDQESVVHVLNRQYNTLCYEDLH